MAEFPAKYLALGYHESQAGYAVKIGRKRQLSDFKPIDLNIAKLLKLAKIHQNFLNKNVTKTASPLVQMAFLQVPQKMFPYVLPLCISKLRRVNILMRSCYVLLCNAEALQC